MNSKHLSVGTRLRAALESEHPLQVVGTINAYSAFMAERVGFRALYVSGAGVANASLRENRIRAGLVSMKTLKEGH